ncbi:MAG: sigma-70 family RNA polymerase sigma factor [Chloroflexi bacterium]|nr:sigma-70 family RNA polymerase sigma factor [Chloroflexota bacterium]
MQREEELVRRAQMRDPAAFGQLYEEHFDRIYRYIVLRVRNQADAEDLTQQVFLKALEHIGSYRHRGMPFASWLFRIAHNQVVDHWKKKSREKVKLLTQDEMAEAGALSGDDPADLAERKVGLEQLAAACERLSDGQREVISLRFAGGLSVAETAKVMGKREGAVKVLQHAALKKLRVIVRAEDGEADV